MEAGSGEQPENQVIRTKSVPEEYFMEETAAPIASVPDPEPIRQGTGRIHSVESMGLSDGPGIRSVVFFQGCALRCRYCHNPDTWATSGGNRMTPDALLARLLRFKGYYDRSGGGVTCSGGEPLLQPEFLIRFLKRCREHGIHTALDTAGAGIGRYDAILSLTDLVILDIKHWEPEAYHRLTGSCLDEVQDFHGALRASGIPVWIRHVMVPGLTDSEEHMAALAQLIRSFPNVQSIEVLPYHTLGVEKYEVLNLPYWLEGTEPMNRGRAAELEQFLKTECGCAPGFC